MSEWASSLFQLEEPPICAICDIVYNDHIHFPKIPHVITFDVSSMPTDFVISDAIKFMGVARNTVLKLKGILYFGDNHFTMQMFESEGNVWFHDGLSSSGKFIKVFYNGLECSELNTCNNKKALVTIYCH